jgi:hypothetical protein
MIKAEPVNPVDGARKIENVFDGFGRRAVRKEFLRANNAWTLDSTTRYSYDDWNVACETVDHAQAPDEARYHYWDLDLSGSLQGAGGVGGLLCVKEVTAWKSELVKNAESLFVRKNAVDEERVDMERATERLERNVGQLVIEKEFLKKSASSWGSIYEETHGGTGASPALDSEAGPAAAYQPQSTEAAGGQVRRGNPGPYTLDG